MSGCVLVFAGAMLCRGGPIPSDWLVPRSDATWIRRSSPCFCCAPHCGTLQAGTYACPGFAASTHWDSLSPSRYAMQTEVACPGIATLALLLSLFCQPLSLLALPCQRMSGPDASAVPAGRYRRLRSAQPLRTYAYRIPFSLRLCGALQPQAKGTLPSANENPATALVGTLASLISTSKNPRFEGA